MDLFDLLLNRVTSIVEEVTDRDGIALQHENEVDYGRRVARETINWKSPFNPEKNLYIHLDLREAGIFFRRRIKVEVRVLAYYSNGAINAQLFPDMSLNKALSSQDLVKFDQAIQNAAEWALRNSK